MTVTQNLKGIIEGTRLAPIYRAVRNEWRLLHTKFSRTPRGYSFAGRSDMQACSYEPSEASLVESFLAEADVFVDIGANIGYYTCLSRSSGTHTIAIEPLAENLAYLLENLYRNGWNDRVEVYPLALSDQPGLARLYGGATAASLLAGWAGASSSYCRTVALSTLDIILGNRFADRQMVIKIDVEGAEYAALKGATNTMQLQPRPIWLVEITLSAHRTVVNPHFMSTFDLFWNLRYSASPVSRPDHVLSRTELEEYARTGENPELDTGNYLFRAES